MKPANCKITVRMQDRSTLESNVLILWINDKTGSITVKMDSGYQRFAADQVLAIEWIPRSRIVQRWSELGDLKLWGFDTREGFASFGHTEQDRQLAAQCLEMYNSGEVRNWVFLSFEKHPICQTHPEPK